MPDVDERVLDARVAALKKRISDISKDRVLAEQQAAVAADRLEQATRSLADEYGLFPEQVPAAVNELKDDLDAEVRRVAELLEQAEEKSE